MLGASSTLHWLYRLSGLHGTGDNSRYACGVPVDRGKTGLCSVGKLSMVEGGY